ncbi:unnamed protein product [Linum trigynum]|uniref:Uncharacterized protein n=1 Tax=Linum trigynum TaxID=586398 RepID=A0AAV2CCD1_9ROSI
MPMCFGRVRTRSPRRTGCCGGLGLGGPKVVAAGGGLASVEGEGGPEGLVGEGELGVTSGAPASSEAGPTEGGTWAGLDGLRSASNSSSESGSVVEKLGRGIQ